MIRVAVVGVGRWGVHWLRNFQQHPKAEVVAVVEHSRERLAQVQQQFDLDSNRIQLATDWNRIKSTVQADAVVVATPPSSHYQLVENALKQGFHVLAEKPLTLDQTSSLALTRQAAASNRLLLVDHTYLFHPVVRKGKQIVAGGDLGQLRYGYASRTNLGPVRYDVDALWDLAIHDLAIFNYWLGETPIKVQAKGNGWLQTQSTINQNTLGLADLVWLKLIYPSGFEATVHLCWSNPDKQRRLCVVGSQGCLIFDEMSQEKLVIQQGGFEFEQGRYHPTNLNRQVIEVEASEPLKIVCDTFVESIINGVTDISLSSGLVAAKLVQLLECLSQSMAEDGQIVEVPVSL